MPQLGDRHNLLQSEVEAGGEIGINILGRSAFQVEPVLVDYTRAVGHYTQNAAALKTGHTDVMEEAVHFWRAAGILQDALRFLNFLGHGEVLTTHSLCTNALTSID